MAWRKQNPNQSLVSGSHVSGTGALPLRKGPFLRRARAHFLLESGDASPTQGPLRKANRRELEHRLGLCSETETVADEGDLS